MNTEPANGVGSVTPSDTVNLARRARSIYVGGAGNVSLVAFDGTTATFVGLAAGSVIPVWTTRVNATGTTATSILALY